MAADGEIGETGETAVEPGAEAAPVDRIHWLQRSMAGAAVLLAAVVMAWGLMAPFGLFLAIPFIAVTWTLFIREREGFRALCLGVGWLGTILGVVLACFGFFAMIPSAVILLMARSADPRRRPVLARVYAGITAVLTVAALTAVGALAYDVWLRPSYSYSVDVPGLVPGERGDLWQYGVTGISESGIDEPGHLAWTRLKVTYDKSLGEAERAALRDALARLPGAGPVKDCGRGDC